MNKKISSLIKTILFVRRKINYLNCWLNIVLENFKLSVFNLLSFLYVDGLFYFVFNVPFYTPPSSVNNISLEVFSFMPLLSRLLACGSALDVLGFPYCCVYRSTLELVQHLSLTLMCLFFSVHTQSLIAQAHTSCILWAGTQCELRLALGWVLILIPRYMHACFSGPIPVPIPTL